MDTNHGHETELIFQIFRQLLTTGVSRVHCEEDAELWIHVNCVAVSENELLTLLSFARKNDGNLLGSHRENGQFNTIELVEATPRARLSETFVDSTQTAEIHLITAVKNHHVFAQRFAHVFGRLSFPSSGRTARTTAHAHVECLSERDVT